MTTFDQLLSLVRRPGQYAGGEVGAQRKDPARLQARLLLAYPDLYEIGMSYLGLQVLYDLVNSHPELAAERVFAPEPDMEKALREAGLPLSSLESRSPMGAFDAVGFSLQHELNYPDILVMLRLGGIPWRADERGTDHPLVLAGGPGAANPEPLAPALDAVVLGDGEPVLPELLRRLGRVRRQGGSRDQQLDAIAELQGVYLPGRYRVRYGSEHGGIEAIEALGSAPRRPRRVVVEDLNAVAPPARNLVAASRTIHDRLAVEIQRGCTRGCRFCQAGMINRPVRQRSAENVLDAVDLALSRCGHEQVSFLSLSAGDHARIMDLLLGFYSRHAAMRVAASLPSLRAETLTPELAELVRTVRKSGFTIAPEAGSERMRRIINKDIREADVLAAARGAFDAGWQLLKLYFMVGLPGEEDSDRQAIVELVAKVRRELLAAGHKVRIHVGISTFVPKAHTPFQWEGMLRPSESRAIHDMLRAQLKKLGGVKVGWTLSELSWAEGLLSRGDRRLFAALSSIAESGARLSSWNEHFDAKAFERAFAALDVPGGADAAYLGPRSPGTLLPWSHLDLGPSEDFLEAERRRALLLETTADCAWNACVNCGACQQGLAPRLDRGPDVPGPVGSLELQPARRGASCMRLRLSKKRPASWLGHLEFMVSVHRALRRAGWPLAFTEGFHPKLKIAFGPPCPAGAESLAEWLDVWLTEAADGATLAGSLAQVLPEGVELIDWRVLPEEAKSLNSAARRVRYRLLLGGLTRAQAEAGRDALLARGSWVLWREVKGRRKQVELRPSLLSLDIESGAEGPEALLELDMGSQATARPSEVAAEAFGLRDVGIIRDAIEFADDQSGSGT